MFARGGSYQNDSSSVVRHRIQVFFIHTERGSVYAMYLLLAVDDRLNLNCSLEKEGLQPPSSASRLEFHVLCTQLQTTMSARKEDHQYDR